MSVIIGLGNPGQTFHGTRHNVGFAVLQRVAERHQVNLAQRRLDQAGRPAGVMGQYQEGQAVVQLLMPLTMMNESGDALRGLEAPPSELLIVCDDINLPLGTLRLRPEGSAGGHHGLQSCLEALGTERVPRLRLGVGGTDMPRDVRDYVLAPFASRERPLMKQMIEQAADACETWAKEGVTVAMNRYNKVQDA